MSEQDQQTTKATPKKAKPLPQKRIPTAPVLDATKKRIHPRFVAGKYQKIRLFSMYAILAGFLIVP